MALVPAGTRVEHSRTGTLGTVADVIKAYGLPAVLVEAQRAASATPWAGTASQSPAGLAEIRNAVGDAKIGGEPAHRGEHDEMDLIRIAVGR